MTTRVDFSARPTAVRGRALSSALLHSEAEHFFFFFFPLAKR